jgi:hypothetical protein
MKHILFLRTLIGLCLLLATFACGGSGGGGGSSSGLTGEMVIEITDAPLDRALVARALIDVSAIRVHTNAQSSSGFLTLYSGAPISIDLLTLSNGLTKLLVRADVPVGNYRQVRLVIDSALLELTNGNVYSTAGGNLTMTSTGTSGLKIFIQPDLVIQGGLSRTMLLDIDLSKTFHPIPANDPLNATSFKLMPVIKASNLSDTGELRGRVLEDNGAGGTQGVANANVSIQPPGDPDPANSIAGTGTLSDGSWRVIGLQPGTYDVLATSGGLQGLVPSQIVILGNATLVDVLIQ